MPIISQSFFVHVCALFFSGLMLWPFKISMVTCIKKNVWVPCQIWQAFFWCKWQSDIATLAQTSTSLLLSGSSITSIQILFLLAIKQYVNYCIKHTLSMHLAQMLEIHFYNYMIKMLLLNGSKTNKTKQKKKSMLSVGVKFTSNWK